MQSSAGLVLESPVSLPGLAPSLMRSVIPDQVLPCLGLSFIKRGRSFLSKHKGLAAFKQKEWGLFLQYCTWARQSPGSGEGVWARFRGSWRGSLPGSPFHGEVEWVLFLCKMGKEIKI